MVGILGANSLSGGGYEISNSLRFNDDDSPYLSFTPGSAGNRRTFTLSVWFKLQSTTTTERILLAADDGTGGNNNFDYIAVKQDSKILVYGYEGTENQQVISTQILRDPSAWYHLVVAFDTTQGTAANRIKVYLNGLQITDFETANYPSENFQTRINNANEQKISSYPDYGDSYFDGYMAEYHLIDGQQLTPSDFGEFNNNGVWIPKAYTGAYGTNGFYLEFKETGTGTDASGMGADTSGNDHHWAVTNLAATDVTTDTPTNSFATFNALLPHTQTLSEGNTKVSNATEKPSLSTLGVSSGKWYAEIKFVSGTNCRIGWANENGVNENFIGANSWIKINGQIFYHDSSGITSQGQAISAGDTIIMAVDVDAGKLWWGKNGTWDDNASGTGVPADGTNPTYTDSGISDGGFIFFGVASGSGAIVYSANFGNAPYAISSGNADANGYGNFEYAPPSGYYSLCTKNLAEFG
jgi:glucan-binding YG repeat protein